MHKPSLLAAAMLTAFSGGAFATTISGKVTDQSGAPIKGAEITVEGSRRAVFTDENGVYTMSDVSANDIHVHVSSNKYLHGDKDLGRVTGDQQLNFTLAPASVENIVVTATAMQTSVLESVTPVSVLSAEELRRKQAPTLGETLKTTPGVHSTYFGPVSSSPVIRGASGPRVKIVQNGLDVGDVSRIGPDHNVAASTSSATQVEVLRGPATLQYGSGAIGGVVNVVDNRIPQEMPYGTEGEAELRYSTVDNGKFGKVDVTTGKDNVAFHFDGFKRKTDDVDIPGYSEIEPDEDASYGTLESTDMDTTDFNAGISYIQDEGYIGFAVEKLDNQYGVPGHHHHHEEEHDHEDEDHEHEEEGHEEGTKIDVDMTRYQLAGELHSPTDWIDNVRFAAAYTDYSHVEIEDGAIGTEFNNKSSDVKITVAHTGVRGWHGVFGLQYNDGDYEAVGEEAFSPATSTSALSAFLVEQKKVGDVTFELGGRVERVSYDADDAEVELHVEHLDDHDHDHEGEEHDHEEHDEEDHDEEHEDEHDHDEELMAYSFPDYDFTAVSLSAGANWEYQPGYSVAVTLSRNERAPSQQELFSGGQHIATRTFEVGLVYDMNEEGELSDDLREVEKEVSTNLDLTFRKFSGNWGYTASFFYTQADDYIYESGTGLLAVSEEHEEEAGEEGEAHEHGDEEGTAVFYFQQADADLYGFEAEVFYNITDEWRVEAYGDYIRAKIDNGDLPRIPPLRLGSTLRYQGQSLGGEIGIEWYDEQTRTASYETATDGYTMLNASVEYDIASAGVDWVLFASADNITDEEARVHTSFLKDLAPLPGRNFSVGVRAVF